MERIKSLGNWLIILLILVGTAVVAVIWPVVAQSLSFSGLGGNLMGGPTRPITGTTPIVFPLPEPIAAMVGSPELVINGMVAFAVILGIVAALVVGVGLVITLLMRLGGKFTVEVAESEAYQKHVATLEGKEKEKLNAKRESQPAHSQPDGYVYGLDPISFSLVVLFFVALMATLIYGLISPGGEITMFGQTFNSSLPILIILFAITIPLLAWLVRRSRLDAVAEKDNASIPWDFIAVLITGLLVVGVGLGLMLFINSPA